MYSSNGNGNMRGLFEDRVRGGAWRVEVRKPRLNEIIIEAGRRQFWQILLTQAATQIDEFLDSLGSLEDSVYGRWLFRVIVGTRLIYISDGEEFKLARTNRNRAHVFQDRSVFFVDRTVRYWCR